MGIINDEPVYEDALGHHALARRVGHLMLKCDPPYVIGVCGSWGAGKTSFLKMLWAYLGGPVEWPNHKTASLDNEKRDVWFEESRDDFDKLVGNRNLELIWFNPWQHQFESSPLVALLHEIRRHFSFKSGLFDKAGKIADVTSYATLNALAELGKSIKIPLPSAKGIMEGEREYDAEHFSGALTSQRFRDFFEGAIRAVTQEKEKRGKKGLLVIFIDDLDRCEGDVSYRLLEALKLYLNAHNCVYVLGLDQKHLENSIAKALSGEKDTWRYRPMARDYLSKIFQNLFLLPVPRHTSEYIEKILDPKDKDFRKRLDELFGLTVADWPDLVRAIDENLPHNPRKIKSFISSWKLYLNSLPEPQGDKLDWRLTLILHYLAQFEEPLFRKVEEAPGFYNDHLLKFCREEFNPHPLFYGLELPYEKSQSDSTGDEKGGLDDTVSGSSAINEQKKDEAKPLAEPRIFWISRLIRQLAEETSLVVRDEIIHRHLLQTGDKLPPRAQLPDPTDIEAAPQLTGDKIPDPTAGE